MCDSYFVSFSMMYVSYTVNIHTYMEYSNTDNI